MARVTVDRATVHVEPNGDSATIGGLSRQALVVVLDQRGD
jgi:hypothetical protein